MKIKILWKCESCVIHCHLYYVDSQADEPSLCPYGRNDHKWQIQNPECGCQYGMVYNSAKGEHEEHEECGGVGYLPLSEGEGNE